MHQTIDMTWARHCIMAIVMAMLVAASGVGSFAHALAGCHHPASMVDGGLVESEDHGDAHHETTTNPQVADGETSAHADCYGIFGVTGMLSIELQACNLLVFSAGDLVEVKHNASCAQNSEIVNRVFL
ncbi:MAG: hypothetical protein SH859_08300 [Hyphomicrobium aestuarii]|nr:hypothetical protein [Hyphomicrobium aestuarii]